MTTQFNPKALNAQLNCQFCQFPKRELTTKLTRKNRLQVIKKWLFECSCQFCQFYFDKISLLRTPVLLYHRTSDGGRNSTDKTDKHHVNGHSCYRKAGFSVSVCGDTKPTFVSYKLTSMHKASSSRISQVTIIEYGGRTHRDIVERQPTKELVKRYSI